MNLLPKPPYQHLADDLQKRIEEKHERFERIERAKRLSRWSMSVLVEEDRSWATNFLFDLAEQLGREVR